MIEKDREYIISDVEIERRKKAFTTLILTFALGLILSSADVLLIIPAISAGGVLVLGVILVGLRRLMNRFFDFYSKATISITSGEFERKGRKARHRFSCSEIVNVHTKRTTSKSIREISITLKSEQRIHVDGLKEFEAFEDHLLSCCGEDVVIREHQEKIDYDHPAFYAILGIILGGVTSFSIRFLAGLQDSALLWMSLLFAVYVLGVGIYWLVTGPLTRQYGDKYRRNDLVCGIGIIAAGILIGMYTLFWT